MSKIYDVQDRILSILTSDPFFNDPTRTPPMIPILSQRKADIANEVQYALNNIGLCVLIMLPRINFEGIDQRISLRLLFAVVVSENPTINAVGVNQPAEAVMEKVFQLVHWQPNLAAPPSDPLNPRTGPRDRASRFVIVDPAATLMEPTKNMPSLLNYVLNFETRLTIP
jgi:hypothetical protein